MELALYLSAPRSLHHSALYVQEYHQFSISIIMISGVDPIHEELPAFAVLRQCPEQLPEGAPYPLIGGDLIMSPAPTTMMGVKQPPADFPSFRASADTAVVFSRRELAPTIGTECCKQASDALHRLEKRLISLTSARKAKARSGVTRRILINSFTWGSKGLPARSSSTFNVCYSFRRSRRDNLSVRMSGR